MDLKTEKGHFQVIKIENRVMVSCSAVFSESPKMYTQKTLKSIPNDLCFQTFCSFSVALFINKRETRNARHICLSTPLKKQKGLLYVCQQQHKNYLCKDKRGWSYKFQNFCPYTAPIEPFFTKTRIAQNTLKSKLVTHIKDISKK